MSDVKLDDEAKQEIVGCYKELLSSYLLKPLMGLKGRAFWKLVVEIAGRFASSRKGCKSLMSMQFVYVVVCSYYHRIIVG